MVGIVACEGKWRQELFVILRYHIFVFGILFS